MKLRKAQKQDNERKSFVRLLRLLCFLICLGWIFAGCASLKPDGGELAVRWVTDPADARKSVVEVSGLSPTQLDVDAAEWQRLLAIYAGDVNSNLPPMAGKYEVQSGRLRFTPQFPLVAGVAYHAVFQPEQKPPITAIFQMPESSGATGTIVSQIAPSADLLPENLLKFYVHFSAPMSRGRIYDHIHLRESSSGGGREIELPFLQIDEELWNPEMTRLTLFIDPGRIKRGVLPLEEVGPALETGKRYTLVIDREWQDGAGKPLKESFQKTFNVGAPDREPIDPKRWQIQPPTADTRDALSVNFSEALDHALAQRLITVTLESGETVEGKIVLSEHERRWTFIPANSWRRGRYNLVIQTTLEDLAGNNIGKPFDVDMLTGAQRQIAASTVKLPFEVR